MSAEAANYYWLQSGNDSNRLGVLWENLDWEFSPPQDAPNDELIATDVLDQTAKNILGENGVKRFEQFKLYKEGWDQGKGKTLSLHSVATMETLLNRLGSLPCEPSLFFTRE